MILTIIFLLDCLYLDGSSYTGNMFVTASGIPCQSWTEQCPHRHTMNDTYPELNLAQNFCRNPQSSGKKPWCFTTDRNKRWEYCDVPKCIPGMQLKVISSIKQDFLVFACRLVRPTHACL